jgi:hypothetical protein
MFFHRNTISFAIVICALAAAAAPCDAGTIIKLSLGGDPGADIEFTGGVGGILSTADDTIAGTTGDQNTAVEYTDFLEAYETDIDTSTASFTLDGLVVAGPATTINGALVFQGFAGGTLELYDAANTLLLSGTLTDSALSGGLGPPGTGGLFTTSIATVTGGTLAPYIDPTSLSLSVSLVDINGGGGLSVSALVPGPPGISFGVLDAFTADASLLIAGDFSGIPEPASIALLLMGFATSLFAGRRARH